jgi:hypothetical protein
LTEEACDEELVGLSPAKDGCGIRIPHVSIAMLVRTKKRRIAGCRRVVACSGLSMIRLT